MDDFRGIRVKRIYAPVEEEDGLRVLVDRLWPRGVKKETARLDLWAKQIAPTTDLRKWFAHDPAKFAEFRERYLRELAINSEAARAILDQAGDRPLTLLHAARDDIHNHAVVLREYLVRHGSA